MSIIRLENIIHAPIERCFDLSRSIDLHAISMASHKEKAIGGKTKGLIEPGEEVTWEAKHFGLKQQLTSKITAFYRPYYFQDRMVRGAFKSFTHDHYFEVRQKHTLMKDVFEYRAPLGILGSLSEKMFLDRYMTSLLVQRNQTIQEIAEGNRWRELGVE